MNEGPPPSDTSLAGDFADELGSRPADERVYRVALQLSEPTRVATIAERADCATDTARRHLRKLVDIGVLEGISENPDVFARNESYFEWRKRNRLTELSEAQLQDRLRGLTEQAAAFRDEYGADDPADVNALDYADHTDVESVWLELSEWRTVRERIERLEAVRRERFGQSGVA